MSDEINEKVSGGVEQEPAPPACSDGRLYTVKSGDTMFLIAKRFNVSLQSLVNANPHITDPSTIYSGQVLCIPTSAPGIPCPGGQIYKVVRGDTMHEIARRYGITLNALISANPQVKDPGEIFPGQEICIPAVSRRVNCPGGMLYTVKTGDTLFEIARKNNITLAALVAANPQVSDPDRIFSGQVICIPAAMAGVEPPTPPSPIPPIASPVTPPTPFPAPVTPVTPPTAPAPMPMPAIPSMPSMPPAPMVPMPSMPSMPTAPGMQPCPPSYGRMPMCPMPVYVVVPWDECPYRPKNKRDRRKKYCR